MSLVLPAPARGASLSRRALTVLADIRPLTGPGTLVEAKEIEVPQVWQLSMIGVCP